VSGSKQVGYAYDLHHHAFLWSGSAASAVDLSPAGFTESFATSVSGSQQVGYGAGTSNQNNAFLWTGSAASAVNLNPSWTGQSVALGTNGAKQVGFANGPSGLTQDAVVWSGSAASAVDLA